MVLSNLITVADYDLSMMLIGIRPDGVEVGYDFENEKWLDNNLFSEERLTTVVKFKNFYKDLYRKCKSLKLKGWSVVNINKITKLEGIETHRGIILFIKIELIPDKFPFVRAYMPKKKSKPKKNYKRKEVSEEKLSEGSTTSE